MNNLQKQALELLDIFQKKEKKYSELNKKIGDLVPELSRSPYLQSIDDEYYEKMMEILDEILDEKLASYLLWDSGGKGLIKTKNKSFKILNVSDIKKYIEWRDLEER